MKLRNLALCLSLGLAALPLVAMPRDAHADAAGDKALASIDAAINRAKTQYLEYDALIKTPDKPDRNLSLAIWIKDDMHLSEFLSPSDVKGTKVLIISPTQMWIYLPAFKKVRRVASHTTDQGFMGMTFSQDDFTLTRYGNAYEGKVSGGDDKNVKLTLTPKKDQTPPYAKIEITAEKARNLPLEMKYYNASGTLLKTETRSGYTCEKDICAPAELKMVDHTKGGQSTMLTRKAWKPNLAIADSKFTKRALEE